MNDSRITRDSGGHEVRPVTTDGTSVSETEDEHQYVVLQGLPFSLLFHFVSSTSLHAAEAIVKEQPMKTENHVYTFGSATRFLQEAQANKVFRFTVSAAGIEQVDFLCSASSAAAAATVNKELGDEPQYMSGFTIKESFLDDVKGMIGHSGWKIVAIV